MDPIEDKIKRKLSSDSENSGIDIPRVRFGWDNPRYDTIEEPVRNVISAYQNANRWLDTLKEHILIELDCPYFSYIVHMLAHDMPKRFDSFGDILHKDNLTVPYPSTEEWSGPLGNIEDCIESIYDMLDAIKMRLLEFKKVAEDAGLQSMSIDCDPLVSQVSSDYYFYIRVEQMLEHYGKNLPAWDKRCYELYKSLSEIK